MSTDNQGGSRANMFITLENISHQYANGVVDSISALSDVSLNIEKGETVGIMGKTGCGKTTLLQVIAGLVKPASGKVCFNGENIWDKTYDKSKMRARIGVVFQYPEYQIFENTVEKDVAFGLKHSGLKKEVVKKQVKEALELMGFDYEAIRKQPPLALSGGEKRRVAIAGVLAIQPQLILFDEPVAGLDGAGCERFYNLVNYLKQQGKTIVMISHQADAISACVERLIYMEDGRIVADDKVAIVYQWLAEHRGHEGFKSTGNVWQLNQLLRNNGLDMPNEITTYNQLLEALKKI